MNCLPLNFIIFLLTEIKNLIFNISRDCLISKIHKFLVCMKMLILLIKINNQLKLWKLYFLYNLVLVMHLVEKRLIKLLWKWLINFCPKFLFSLFKVKEINNISLLIKRDTCIHFQ